MSQVFGLYVIAVLVRLAYLFAARPAFETLYWSLSTSLLLEGSLSLIGRPATDFEPLYPLFLAAARLISQDQPLVVQVLQVATASLGAVFLYRLAHVLTGRHEIAAIAAALYAFDPLLIRQAGAPADLALTTTLLVVFAYCFVSATTTFDAALAGAVLGLVILTRMTALPIALLAFMILAAERRIRAAVTMMIVIVALLAPFVMRNWAVNGSLWPTRSGLSLYIANSPYGEAMVPDHDVDLLQEHAGGIVETELAHLADNPAVFERAADEVLTKHAVEHMLERPLRTLRNKALNAVHFLLSPRLAPLYIASPDTRAVFDSSGRVTVENPQPRPLVEVVVYFAFYTFILSAALVGVYVRRHDMRRDRILWSIVAAFVAVHALYFPATRYRAPMKFVLLFYAAVGLQQVWSAIDSPHEREGLRGMREVP